MKRNILILAALLIVNVSFAQGIQKSSNTNIELRAGAGIEWFSQAYRAYYELPRAGALVQVHYGAFLFGAGFDTISLKEDGGHETAINLRAGVEAVNYERMTGAIYWGMEKAFGNGYDLPITSGVGMTLSFKIAGPLSVYTDLRYHMPIFASRYERYHTNAGVLSVGLSFNF